MHIHSNTFTSYRLLKQLNQDLKDLRFFANLSPV